MSAKELTAQEFLDGAFVANDVFDLRPDYRVLLIVVEGMKSVPSNDASEKLLVQAEAYAVQLLSGMAVQDLPHIASWREAYRAFGAKPQRTRNSLEALTRRAEKGLPRINALTDIYNAISVLHQVPIGGEDFDHYRGSPQLVRARGDESFDAVASGEVVMEHPEVGEVVWRDDEGVTCRRWNWRQGRRTGLSDETSTAYFIFDCLDPMTNEELTAAGDALIAALGEMDSDLTTRSRLITRD